MPEFNIFTIPPGHDLAQRTARHLVETLGETGLPKAVIFVPTRRAVVTLRDGFRRASGGVPLLLPRILPLGDIDSELLLLLGRKAPAALTALPPAMSDWQRLCLLVGQVQLFAKGRLGKVSLEQALRLATDLADLQDRFARASITPRMESLAVLAAGDFAAHWQHALEFLAIAFEHWPQIERAYGMTTQATRQLAATELLSASWEEEAPDFPVYAVGSTASQPATAHLLKTIASLPKGTVILPGLDTSMASEPWEAVASGHPYFHLKSFLDDCDMGPGDVPSLESAPSSSAFWLETLAAAEAIPDWRRATPIRKEAWGHIRLIPCRHPEEEARVIAMVMREAAEDPQKRTALVTPDEGLMARVAAQLARFGIEVDRVAAGTLATTQTGSLLMALMEAIAAPERSLPLLNLLRHKLVIIGEETTWRSWLADFEPHVRGVATQSPDSLPALPQSLRDQPAHADVARLVREIAKLARGKFTTGGWTEQLGKLLESIVPQAGEGQETIGDAFEALGFAELLGPLDAGGFASLLKVQLDAPWRRPALLAQPNLAMLTPVEARLQHFDRVILGNMQARLWPGLSTSGPWLNLTQQQALGLPGPQEAATLMGHDLLMLGSVAEIFLTWPLREGGAATTRSPYIERLVARLALQNIDEEILIARDYLSFARQAFAAEEFRPEEAAQPRPATSERPRELPVTDLDKLFSDPYSIYARHVLGLRALDEIDAEPETVDFGSIAHAAIYRLSQHWDEFGVAADATKLGEMVETALAPFGGRPNIELFWKDRLRRALTFVNAMEVERRQVMTEIKSETKLQETIALPGDRKISLKGRVDRLEMAGAGATIGDYKTGEAPKKQEILDGRKVQLLAYAMLLEAQGIDVAALDYWQLPRAGRAGEIKSLSFDDTLAEQLLPPLKAALAQMLDEQTPFLARPLAGDERFENDYDGISRYDEWAG